MRVSCFSLIEMARLAEPLMKDGGTLVTMTYYGADKVVEITLRNSSKPVNKNKLLMPSICVCFL
jgi:hypothetical protein